MSAPLVRSGRQLVAALRATVVATLVLGLLYPLVMTGIAQLMAPGRADGSLLTAAGRVVGSSLIGQAFVDGKGAPLPRYFQSRPSASGYDGAASGGSNLGPNSPDLAKAVQDRRAAIAVFDGVRPSAVPPDAVTASASGLEAGISPAYAAIQEDRVARERGASRAAVARLVAAATVGRDLGFIGSPYVDVPVLNLALDARFGVR
jgi:K+-transporting ATPase ATPase C chain